jgi:rhomboid family GlyGly-CTERM serine protease
VGRSARAVRRLLPFVTLAIACLLVTAGGAENLARLAYARWAVHDGDLWRLLTTHLVHASGAHLAWNLVGLAAVAAVVARELGPYRWTIAAFASGLGASLGVLLLSPRTTAMAGLSGLLHGLLAAGGAAALRRDRRTGVAILGLLVAKLAAERWGLWPATAWLGRATAIDAHLYGALAGALAGMLLAVPPRRRVERQPAQQQQSGEVPAREQDLEGRP